MVAVCSIDSNVVKNRVVYDDDEHESTWLIIIIDTTFLATQSYIFVYTLDNNIEYGISVYHIFFTGLILRLKTVDVIYYQ